MSKKTANQLMDDIREKSARGHHGDKGAVPNTVLGDSLNITMLLPQEWQRDAEWLRDHPELGFTYYPDGHKSMDCPGGKIHLPKYPK